MTKTEIIKWQFVDKYYVYLVEKMRIIDMSLHYHDFRTTLIELRTLFAQIIGPLGTQFPNEKEELEGQFVEAFSYVQEYSLIKLNSRIPDRSKIIKMSKKMSQIETLVHKIYDKLMFLLDQLNMFFPKGTKDHRLPIYQT